MDKDIVINKIDIIERCLGRIYDEYDNDKENLLNYTKQDSIILNIQRACEACIDLAMHMVSSNRLGIPQNSRDAFEMLYDNKIIDKELLNNLKGMIGFKNIAVHNYQSLDIDVLEQVIEKHLEDFITFTKIMLDSI